MWFCSTHFSFTSFDALVSQHVCSLHSPTHPHPPPVHMFVINIDKEAKAGTSLEREWGIYIRDSTSAWSHAKLMYYYFKQNRSSETDGTFDLNWVLESKPCGELVVLGSGSYGKVYYSSMIIMVAMSIHVVAKHHTSLSVNIIRYTKAVARTLEDTLLWK